MLVNLLQQESIHYPEEDCFRHVGLDRNIVIRYHGHLMFVNGEELLPGSSSIDQSESMPFSLLELEFCERSIVCAGLSIGDSGAVEIHLAINEIIVRVLTPLGLVCALDW